MYTDKLFGIYRGVVENNNDPDESGKCQIRIVGIHPINKSSDGGVPTEYLPWAEAACPIFGGISQVGMFGVPCQGAHVFLFFEGGNRTQPRYFATAPGRPIEPPLSTVGFYDPDEIYPKEPGGEPDWYKGKGFSGDGPEYTESFALIDKAGNRIEFDSTEGQEKVLIGVANGASIVFKADGSQETHLAKGTQKTYVGGKVEINGGGSNITITGEEVKSTGGSYLSVLGNKKDMVMGSSDKMIMGIENKVAGGMSYQSKGDTRINAAGDADYISDGNAQLKSNSYDVKIRATLQNIKMQALLGAFDSQSNTMNNSALLSASYGGKTMTTIGGGLITEVSSNIFTKISSSIIVQISAPIIMLG